LTVPPALAAYHATHNPNDVAPGWIDNLPTLAETFLTRWNLHLDEATTPAHGMIALVLPVHRADGTPAALKLQPINTDNADEPTALRIWNGDGAAQLLDHDPDSGTMLLERLDATRPLSSVPDELTALQLLSELLAHLTRHPAPATLRHLGDIATAMLDAVPDALTVLPAPEDRRLLKSCAAALREVIDEPGDRLLHWDLHYDNVLAPLPGQTRNGHPWLAIDPQPLAGDPGFELLPAIGNRWHEITGSGDIPRAVLRRFDLMTEILDLDPDRALRWTLARVLQNVLWDCEDGETQVSTEQAAIAGALLGR
jgi:streptomycin 6-kinase